MRYRTHVESGGVGRVLAGVVTFFWGGGGVVYGKVPFWTNNRICIVVLKQQFNSTAIFVVPIGTQSSLSLSLIIRDAVFCTP